tara:strand:- start:2657 stop:3397 length:741 start_codon:yes stop_codon:yes gene_type:complete
MKLLLELLLRIYKKIPLLQYIWRRAGSDESLMFVYVNGFKLKVFKKHWIRILLNLYEPETLKVFKKILKKDMTFLDIGANVGLFSCIAFNKKANVIAFEPNPFIKKILFENFKGKGIKIFEFALSDRKERLKLFLSDEPGSHSLNLDSKKYVFVKSVTLDSLINTKIDIIKIDIEGAELKALKGMEKLIENFKPFVIIEIDEEHLRRFGENFNSIKSFFAKYNYSYYKIGNENNYLFSYKTNEEDH